MNDYFVFRVPDESYGSRRHRWKETERKEYNKSMDPLNSEGKIVVPRPSNARELLHNDDASKADFKQSIGWDDDIIFIDAEHFDQVYSQHIEKGQTSNEVQIDNEVDASIEQPKNRLDIQGENEHLAPHERI